MAFGHKCFVKRGIEFQTQGRPPDASYPSYSCLKNFRVCVWQWDDECTLLCVIVVTHGTRGFFGDRQR